VDQIFDRLERLFKSWVTPDTDEVYTEHRRPSGNNDYDDAMSELDDFLDKDRAAAEERTREREKREREAKARAEAEARNRARGTGNQAWAGNNGSGGPPAMVVEAYKTLGLAYGAPMKEVKASYKRLLLKYHPDRNSASQEEQKRATDISARINNAYQVIETWTTTGSVPRD
jgi:DnaJ-domain-containing protein 1